MRLQIITNNEYMLLDAANVIVMKDAPGTKGPFIEISCNNHDVYRIICFEQDTKGCDKFAEYGHKLIDAFYDGGRQGQNSFACSFCDYETRITKASFGSHID